MKAEEYRELAKSFRHLAAGADAPRKERLLMNIARSLSGLASQLEALARESVPETKGRRSGAVDASSR